MRKQDDEQPYCCFASNRQQDNLFEDHEFNQDDMDATQALISMYQMKNEAIYETLSKCRLNPNLLQQHRDDLEYYIPQLINYLVFKNNSEQLIEFIYNASQTDFFFAHLVYFQLHSVSQIIGKKTQVLKEVIDFLEQFMRDMEETFGQQLLITAQEFVTRGPNQSKIQAYGTASYEQSQRAFSLNLDQYSSIYQDPINQGQTVGFQSNIQFWSDIITISERLHLANPQIISLKADVSRINSRLPAAVYVPFLQFRNYVVLNIVPTECRVFSTKERAPFYLCLEIYRPDAEEGRQEEIDKRVSMAKTLIRQEQVTMRKSHIKSLVDHDYFDGSSFNQQHKLSVQELDVIEEEEIHETPTAAFYVNPNESYEYKSFKQSDSSQDKVDSAPVSEYHSVDKKEQSVFGESAKDQADRIRAKSPFGTFKSWSLVHVMVKSGDNLKQEQFAMQIISTINQIFLIEKLPITLVTYDVLSLGPSCGIIQMVKDAVTIDSLKRSLFGKQQTLADFFRANFNEAQLQNYLYTLVGYSLAQYIMQLKDRHNGNILLRRDGSLVHIDFGFFLGHAPGKGIELERKMPFKMLNEYIEVLGGVESHNFELFRKHFYQGFQALRKHSDRILLLARMMYSGHGTTMPCFSKGDRCINQLKERFFLDEHNDQELNVICQTLINQSIDNWRARWYDKYQYWVQGIFY